jgi:hypothetical protein
MLQKIREIERQAQARAGHKIELPPVNVGEVEKYYALGQDAPPWYVGSPEKFKEMFGPYADLSRWFNAATSMRLDPALQFDRAMQGMRLGAQHGPEGIRGVKGLGQPTREMEEMLRRWRDDPTANLAMVLNPRGRSFSEPGKGYDPGPMKRTDYGDVLGGAHKPVIDTWEGRLAYGEHPTKRIIHPKTGADLGPESMWEGVGSGRKQNLMYEKFADITTELARFRGVEPETYQGRTWTAFREAAKYMKGNEPFAEQMARRGAASKDYQWLLDKGMLSGVPLYGQRWLAIALALGGAGAGAAAAGAGGEAPPPQ